MWMKNLITTCSLKWFCVCVFFCFSEKSLFCEIQFGRCVRGFWRHILVPPLLSHTCCETSTILGKSSPSSWQPRKGSGTSKIQINFLMKTRTPVVHYQTNSCPTLPRWNRQKVSVKKTSFLSKTQVLEWSCG